MTLILVSIAIALTTFTLSSPGHNCLYFADIFKDIFIKENGKIWFQILLEISICDQVVTTLEFPPPPQKKKSGEISNNKYM